MHSYAIAALAIKMKIDNSFEYIQGVFIKTAASREDAEILVKYKWEKKFPESDGWNRYDYVIFDMGNLFYKVNDS